MREERELMEMNLDQEEILKDDATGLSMQEMTAMKSGEQSSASSFEIIKVIESYR